MLRKLLRLIPQSPEKEEKDRKIIISSNTPINEMVDIVIKTIEVKNKKKFVEKIIEADKSSPFHLTENIILENHITQWYVLMILEWDKFPINSLPKETPELEKIKLKYLELFCFLLSEKENVSKNYDLMKRILKLAKDMALNKSVIDKTPDFWWEYWSLLTPEKKWLTREKKEEKEIEIQEIKNFINMLLSSKNDNLIKIAIEKCDKSLEALEKFWEIIASEKKLIEIPKNKRTISFFSDEDLYRIKYLSYAIRDYKENERKIKQDEKVKKITELMRMATSGKLIEQEEKREHNDDSTGLNWTIEFSLDLSENWEGLSRIWFFVQELLNKSYSWEKNIRELENYFSDISVMNLSNNKKPTEIELHEISEIRKLDNSVGSYEEKIRKLRKIVNLEKTTDEKLEKHDKETDQKKENNIKMKEKYKKILYFYKKRNIQDFPQNRDCSKKCVNRNND